MRGESTFTVRALKPFVPSGPDFNRALAFFSDLGFTIEWQAEGIAELRLGNAVFLLQRFHDPDSRQSQMMRLEVDDLDAFHAHVISSRISEKYGSVVRPPTDYPWGQREVHVVDLAGVLWHVA